MNRPIERLNEKLTGYVLERTLGAGGMATVYLARDERHDRDVAIKVLRPELAAVIGAERFLAEIQTTANLQHPHILPLHDSGEVDGSVFYVMPYVEGETVRERLDREKQLPIVDAVRIAAEVAGALDYAHRKGVIHRDIKPENIMLHDGRAVVADFGIALAASRTDGVERLTETGMSLGTPHYMSPEQATGERELDARADVYALGCVLYEMLVGEPPFTGPTAQSIVAKLLTGDAPQVTEARKTVPPHVAAAVEVALRKLPADRFPTAADFADALNDPTRVTGFAAAASAPQGASPGALGRVIPWAVAAAAVGFALLSGSGGPRDPATPTPLRFALTSPERDGVRATSNVGISEDGRHVVFTGSQDGRSRLFHRSLAERGVEAIPGTDGTPVFFAVSPDGSEVAFWTPDSLVRVAPTQGGRSRVAAHAPNFPIGMSWGSETGLVFGMLAYNGDHPGILVAPPGDTTIRVATDPRADDGTFRGMHHEPYVIPGTDDALFVDFSGDPGPRLGLGLASLSSDENRWSRVDLPGSSIRGGFAIVGVARDVLLYFDPADRLMAIGWDGRSRSVVGEPVPVDDTPEGLRSAALAADGTLAMVVGSSAYEAVLVDDRGTTTRAISGSNLTEFHPRFSPDGSRLAIGAPFQETNELWIFEVSSGLLAQLAIGFGPEVVEWSPDGARVLAARGGRFRTSSLQQVWSRAADARDEPGVVLDLEGQRIQGMSLSPDGRTAALTIDVATSRGSLARYDVVTIDLASAEVTRFASGVANELGARFSPDGRWLAYASDESGRYQVYARPFPGPGSRVQISSEGGGQPVWSRDGTRLFYRTDREMMVADLGTGPGGGLSVIGRERLFEGDFYGDPASPVATYDVHPDGDRFALARAAGGGGGEVVVWTDWIDEVRERLGRATD